MGEDKVEECQNLIESMPRRLEAMIQAKGGHTKCNNPTTNSRGAAP